MLDMTMKEEAQLQEVICSLHPHKHLLATVSPRYFCIRKGWGAFKRFVKDKEA